MTRKWSGSVVPQRGRGCITPQGLGTMNQPPIAKSQKSTQSWSAPYFFFPKIWTRWDAILQNRAPNGSGMGLAGCASKSECPEMLSKALEPLMAFRGTNFSRRTSSDPSRGGLEPYFAKSHPSVSPFFGKKKIWCGPGVGRFWGFCNWGLVRCP